MCTRNRIAFLCLLTVFLPVTLCSEAQVFISPEQPIISWPSGSPSVATCKGEAEDPNLFTNMKWIGSQGVITDDVNEAVYVLQQEPGRLFLTFNNPTLEMSGTYNCTALYDNSVTKEDSVQIIFYYGINFEDCPLVQALVIGTPGKIRCRANANPNAQVTWSKDRQSLEKNRYQIQNDGISVTDVRESDAGTYQISALVQQTGQLRHQKIVVEVHIPPEIKSDFKSQEEVVEGERAQLMCQASGHPPPLYSWFDPLQRNLSSVDGYIVDRNTGTLTIREVRKEDAGMYKCQAINSAAKDEKSLDLTVLVKPEIRQFNNVTQLKDKDVSMECRCVGEPEPDMSIRKDGSNEPLASGDDRIRLKKHKDGEEWVLMLTLQRIIRTDDGLYYCAAVSKAGRAERVGHVTVEFPPDMTNTPAKERKTWNENPVNLTCVAEAIPNATITWYFRNQELRNDETYRIYGTTSQSSLLVRPFSGRPSGSDIYGNYRCEGRNQFGNSSIEINLQEARTPGRIQQTVLDKQTATTITFLVRGLVDNGGLPIKSYLIRYYEDGSSPGEMKSFEWPEGASYILEKLTPRTKYVYSFAAKNDAGIGEYSEDRNFMTLQEAAPEAPVFNIPGGNVSRSPDSFQVLWVMPQDNGKRILKFSLRYFQVKLEGNDWKREGRDYTVDIDNWRSGLKYEIVGLNPNSFYKAELRAINEIGNSHPASLIFQTAVGSARGEQQRLDGGGGILTTPAIVAIVIVVILVILGVLDVTCYLRYHCGLFYCLRTNICGHSSSKSKEVVEDGNPTKGCKELLSNNQSANEAPTGDPLISDPTLKSVEDSPNKTTEVDNPAFDAKDTKSSDMNNEDYKNKSPKGSKSSIAKDSLV